MHDGHTDEGRESDQKNWFAYFHCHNHCSLITDASAESLLVTLVLRCVVSASSCLRGESCGSLSSPQSRKNRRRGAERFKLRPCPAFCPLDITIDFRTILRTPASE